MRLVFHKDLSTERDGSINKSKFHCQSFNYRCCLTYEGKSLALNSCGEDFDELKSKFEGKFLQLRGRIRNLKVKFLHTKRFDSFIKPLGRYS